MRVAIMTGLLAFALLTAGCAAGTLSASASPPEVIRARCTKCHNLDRIRSAKHDRAGWTATLARMRGKGAQVTGAQAAAVVEFLSGGGGSSL